MTGTCFAGGYYWDILSINKDYTTCTSGSYVLFDENEPAVRDGEVQSAGYSINYCHTYSGSIAASLTSAIEISVGYSFGVNPGLSKTYSSASLKEGEYTKFYYKKNYSKSKVKQAKYEVNDFGDVTGPVATETCYPQRALLPKIKIEYFETTASSRNLKSLNKVDEKPYKVEIYDYKDGVHQLIETIYNK
jgi:hypothetical protein